MEFLFEFIFELLVEGSIEASKSRRIPKIIRYPLIALISLFFIAIIGAILFAGVCAFKENVPAGIFIIAVGLLMLVGCVISFRKFYLTKTNKEK